MEIIPKYKVLIKKTKKGKILKLVREHYLRTDIACGILVCDKCNHDDRSFIFNESLIKSSLIGDHVIFILDIYTILNQIDFIEDALFTNVIILQSIAEEVRFKNVPIYKRLRDCIANKKKAFYLFVNEFHRETYVERVPNETTLMRIERSTQCAAQWYANHINAMNFKVILICENMEQRDCARKLDIQAYTINEFSESIIGCDDLKDRVAQQKMVMDKPSVDLFAEHLSLSDVQLGIKGGKFLQGTFQASRENYLEAFVNIRDTEQQVFIQGRNNLNRAVSDDVVAVEMLPEADWSHPSSLVVEDAGEKMDTDDEDDEAKIYAKNEKEKSLNIPTGRIVGIIKRNWRQYCGILQKGLLKGSVRHLFVPAERRIPKIRIETRQADLLEGQKIIVVIDGWPRNSRYPQGHFVRRLGEIGDKNTENEVLLIEHDIPHSSFSEAVLNCLPKLPWIISQEDIDQRIDLRNVAICSVDPPGCTDIDDALHCRQLEDGNLEVGVHIADVSHFIKPNTPLDIEASLRGNTVYLIDKRIDMVPELLSSNLCSLRGGEERFAFSVIWKVNKNAEVLDCTFAKSIIKSKAALTYAEAQMRIDDPKSNDDVTVSLRKLNQLAKILKKMRIENGALTLASMEIRFHIDSETHDPLDVQSKEILETNSMVEEFMLLANIYTAQKILSEFPECAVLRRHPCPPESNYALLINAGRDKGFEIDTSSGKALSLSLKKAVIPTNPYFNTMLRILATRCMLQAVYFCSGSISNKADYYHYGLATGVYTHFTSPIRRYSDILVHRLLAVAIGKETSYPDLLDKLKIQNICNNLNYRHRMAQYAGRASVALHTQIFFKDKISDENGYVLFIRKNALQVLIPKYGLEGTVYLEDSTSDEPSSKRKKLGNFNEQDNSQTINGITIKSFDPVIVRISIDKTNIQHQKLTLKLVKPVIPGLSV